MRISLLFFYKSEILKQNYIIESKSVKAARLNLIKFISEETNFNTKYNKYKITLQKKREKSQMHRDLSFMIISKKKS